MQSSPQPTTSTSECHHEHHRVKVLEAEIAALKEANAVLRRDLDVSRAEVASLANAVVSKDARIAALECQERELLCAIKRLESEISALSERVRILTGDNESLRKRLEIAEIRIVELYAEVEKLKLEASELRCELERAHKREHMYKHEYDIAKKELKIAEEALKHAEERVAELLKVIDKLQEEIKHIKSVYWSRVSQVMSILEKPL